MINYPHFDIGDIKFKPITFFILSFPQQQPAPGPRMPKLRPCRCVCRSVMWLALTLAVMRPL